MLLRSVIRVIRNRATRRILVGHRRKNRATNTSTTTHYRAMLAIRNTLLHASTRLLTRLVRSITNTLSMTNNARASKSIMLTLEERHRLNMRYTRAMRLLRQRVRAINGRLLRLSERVAMSTLNLLRGARRTATIVLINIGSLTRLNLLLQHTLRKRETSLFLRGTVSSFSYL